MYFKVAPRQTISAAVLREVRAPLVLHHSQNFYENTIWHLNVQWGDYDSSDILLFVELGQASRVPQERETL